MKKNFRQPFSDYSNNNNNITLTSRKNINFSNINSTSGNKNFINFGNSTNLRENFTSINVNKTITSEHKSLNITTSTYKKKSDIFNTEISKSTFKIEPTEKKELIDNHLKNSEFKTRKIKIRNSTAIKNSVRFEQEYIVSIIENFAREVNKFFNLFFLRLVLQH